MDKKSNLLIIDNDLVTAKCIESELRTAVYEVSGVAGNLTDAIALMSKKPTPDLALIDLKLDGAEEGIIEN